MDREGNDEDGERVECCERGKEEIKGVVENGSV